MRGTCSRFILALSVVALGIYMNPATASAAACNLPLHYLGYTADGHVFGGVQGWINTQGNVPTLPDPDNDAKADWIGANSIVADCHGGKVCWMQEGAVTGNWTIGNTTVPWMYWESTSEYQYRPLYIRLWPTSSQDVFVNDFYTGSNDANGHPTWTSYYSWSSSPYSPVLLAESTQRDEEEQMQANTEVHTPIPLELCPTLGQTNFGFPPSGSLTTTYGLGNAPNPPTSWTAWTSSSFINDQGTPVFNIADWEHYWAFSTYGG